jgi:hypothetical protein
MIDSLPAADFPDVADDAADQFNAEAEKAAKVAREAEQQAKQIRDFTLPGLEQKAREAILSEGYAAAHNAAEDCRRQLAALETQADYARHHAKDKAAEAEARQTVARRRAVGRQLAGASEKLESLLAQLCRDNGELLSDIATTLELRRAAAEAASLR